MSPEKRGYELSLELPAAHRGVRIARNVVRHFARLSGLNDRDTGNLVLVLDELMSNSIDHGGGGAAREEDEVQDGARTHLLLELSATGWVLRVSDQGGGDPTEIRKLLDPGGTPDLEDERGRGFFLLAQMVDRVEVETSADGLGLTLIASKGYAADG